MKFSFMTPKTLIVFEKTVNLKTEQFFLSTQRIVLQNFDFKNMLK